MTGKPQNCWQSLEAGAAEGNTFSQFPPPKSCVEPREKSIQVPFQLQRGSLPTPEPLGTRSQCRRPDGTTGPALRRCTARAEGLRLPILSPETWSSLLRHNPFIPCGPQTSPVWLPNKAIFRAVTFDLRVTTSRHIFPVLNEMGVSLLEWNHHEVGEFCLPYYTPSAQNSLA